VVASLNQVWYNLVMVKLLVSYQVVLEVLLDKDNLEFPIKQEDLLDKDDI